MAKSTLFQSINLETLGNHRRTLNGHTPHIIDQSEQIWLVLRGYVDLFAVPLQADTAVGTRWHVLRIFPGHLILNMPLFKQSDAEYIGLLAVGAMDTEVLEITWSDFLCTSHLPIFTLLDDWIKNLSIALANNHIRWVEYIVKPGTTTTIPSGVALSGKRQSVVWVTVEAGQLRYLNSQKTFSTGECLPLTDKSWLQTISAAQITCADTPHHWRQNSLSSQLIAFHTLAIALIAAQMQTARQLEQQRLTRKIKMTQKVVENTYHDLADVLKSEHAQWLVKGDAVTPLSASLQLISKTLGFSAAPFSKPTPLVLNNLDQIIHFSRLRLRRVVLADNWWQQDNGPLLGFWKETKQPVALLPTSTRQYTAIDPSNQSQVTVTRPTAHTLSGEAFMFYRTFPHQSLSTFNLLSFSTWGTGKDILQVLSISLLVSLLGLVMPVATGLLFESIIPRSELTQLFHLVIALGLVAFSIALFELTKAFALLRIEGKLDSALQAAVWDKLLNLPAIFFKNYTAGDLADRALSIHTIRQILTGATITSLLASLFSLSSLLLLFYYHATLAWMAVLLASSAVIFTMVLSYLQLRQQRVMLAQQGKIEGFVFQVITGITKLRIAACESQAMAMWAKYFAAQKRCFVKANTYENSLVVFHIIFPSLAALITFMLIVHMKQESNALAEFSTGDFLAFYAAFGQFLAAMNNMSRALTSALTVIPLFERVKPILTTRPENTLDKRSPAQLQGELEISHLVFRYLSEGARVLDGLSLNIQAGQFVAIVGSSGSGKSTLFRLLLGFETPESGAIYYDGKNLAILDIASVRRQIGVVLQDGKLSAGSIFENIVGNAPLTHDDAWRAARLVGLDKDIKAMPMGMHTMLMEGAVTLSGGQKQRLLLARAIVHRPRILLLDEATSALDNQTQGIVIDSLVKLNTTRIVIAHRLSTITQVDKILVMHNGQIVQTGVYEELIKQAGPFAELAKRQIL